MSKTRKIWLAGLIGTSILFPVSSFAQAPNLFRSTQPAQASQQHNALASQSVKLNRRAIASKTMSIDLFGETVTAVRTRIEHHKAGQTIWVGHLKGAPEDSVVITVQDKTVSGLVQRGDRLFRLGHTKADGSARFLELDVKAFPDDEEGPLPEGGGDFSNFAAADGAEGNVQQDILIVYTQAACNYAGSCTQLEADMVTAVADTNTAYAESGINITMNMVGMRFTDYVEGSNTTTVMLADIQGTNDGEMDEIHGIRDQLGADLVSFIYRGDGCGRANIAANASTAFSVTDIGCVSGRTFTHEVGHNQGARHNRKNDSTGDTSTGYNYGFRRCDDNSDEDLGAPFFRTVMGYSCTGASRVGRFSNPNVNYNGVPQGLDPAADPLKGTWNARTLNESASYVASFRSNATTPPVAPSSLSASASGHDTIVLNWADNASDETSFNVQSSTDGNNWSTIAQLSANTLSYTDTGLNADTTYYYRVNAQNSAGASAYTAAASATTDSLPASVDDVATGENASTGTVTGSYTNTHADDGAVQTITEVSSGGPKRQRQQSYIHQWSFDVTGGAGGAVLTANAWVSGQEGANFAYSVDNGASWSGMFTVNETDSANVKTFALPGATSGNILVEARDAAQTNGEAADSLFVDYLVVTSQTQAGAPPSAPTALSANADNASSISVSFTDNASDEYGFEIWRSGTDPQGDCNAGSEIGSIGANSGTGSVSYTDMSVSPSTTYWYWAKAFNGAGDGGLCSNADSATTPVGAAITLGASGYKDKGKQVVDLTWSGASGSQVDILRDNAAIVTTGNDGAYTDNIGVKGSATYSYKVCEAGSTTVCSDPVQVIF